MTAPPDRSAEPGTLAIVFGHPDGRLPNPWYRAYRRAKKAVGRSGWDADVLLRPLTRLPDGVDVLVADPSFGASRSVAPEILSVTADDVARGLDGLLEAYEAEGRLRHAPSAARAVAVHIGFQPQRGRARASE